MNIQLQFSLTPDDFYEFQMAYTRHRRALTPRSQRGLRSPLLLVWAVLIVIVVLFEFGSSWFTPGAPAPPPAPGPPPPPPTLRDYLLPIVPFAILFLILFGFISWVRRSRFLYRRMAATSARLGEEKTAELTDTQFTLRDPTSTYTAAWSHFIRMIETKNTFLLFIVPRAAHILPKRGFPSEAALDEFRQFALAHIGNQPIGFPVLPPATASGDGAAKNPP